MAAKQSYFNGMAQYYMGRQSKEDKKFGPSLARMQVCGGGGRVCVCGVYCMCMPVCVCVCVCTYQLNV